jgi:flagellar L-ring protein FlgH
MRDLQSAKGEEQKVCRVSFPFSGFRLLLKLCIFFALAGCGAVDRLSSIGKAPVLSSIEDPTAQPGYKPVRLPMPDLHPVSYASNSLWRTGSRAFFKDQRAAQMGDILTVRVRVTDSAQLNNQTSRSRQGSESMGVENMLGFEGELGKVLPDGVQADALVNTKSSGSSQGAGSVRRSEQLATNVAAIVTQVLPNGNLVIEGKQEIRVNFEVRELIVAGVVRPEDIEADNTIDSTKIAQARIAYGGRGQISDVQQPRYGQQVMDVLLPF